MPVIQGFGILGEKASFVSTSISCGSFRPSM